MAICHRAGKRVDKGLDHAAPAATTPSRRSRRHGGAARHRAGHAAQQRSGEWAGGGGREGVEAVDHAGAVGQLRQGR